MNKYQTTRDLSVDIKERLENKLVGHIEEYK